MTTGTSIEAAIDARAASQRTVITQEQLLACGLGRRAIAYRRTAGRLKLQFPGVYSVGCGVLPPLGLEQAAVLACGEDAFLSHSTSAAMWQMLPRLPDQPHVSIAGRYVRAREGMHIHLVAAVDPRELRRKEGLAVSSPARALLEIAATREREELARAFDEAFGRRLVRPDDIAAVLARHPAARGTASLRALLEEGDSEGFLRSRGERAFRTLIRKAGMTQPQANARVDPYTVDFLWRDQRLIVEFDGWDFHRGRAKFESDRARDTALKAMGFEVIRFTWRQVLQQPELVLFRLGQVTAAIRLRA